METRNTKHTLEIKPIG